MGAWQWVTKQPQCNPSSITPLGTGVCMYVRMCVCIICMYVCMYVYVLYVCMYVLYVHMYVCMYVLVCMYM